MARFVLALLLFAGALLPAHAQYPSRPIRIVIGFASGSAADIVARVIGAKLQETWTAGLIVDAKAGAAGLIATQEVARAAPDGYTLLLAAQSQISLPPNTNRYFPADLLANLTPVAELANADLSFAVSPQHVPPKTLPEYLTWAKSRKAVFMGDFGPGSITHLAGALLAHLTRLNFEPIHYKSTADIWNGVFNGDLQGMFFATGTIVPYAKSGKIRVLATTGKARLELFPDVPTFKELGFPDLEVVSWYGLMAPAKTPPEIVDALSAAFIAAVKSPAVRAKLEEIGFRASGMGREEFARMIREDSARWAKVVSAIGFKMID